MSEGLKFQTPQEELEYLRSRVLEVEKQNLGPEQPLVDREALAKQSIQDFKEKVSSQDITSSQEKEIEAEANKLSAGSGEFTAEQMLTLSEKKGVFYALRLAEKLEEWDELDRFHALLIERILQGLPTVGVKESGPIYQALHMKLFEIVLPKALNENEKPFVELVKSMEQLYAGLLSVVDTKTKAGHLTFEFANPEGEESTRAFVSVPVERVEHFNRQLLAIFPKAKLLPRERDYTIFSNEGKALGAVAKLSAHPAYPLKALDDFGSDPLNVILSGFSQMPTHGAGAALQVVFKPAGDTYTKKFEKYIKSLEKGKSAKEVLRDDGLLLDFARSAGSILFGGKKKDKKEDVSRVDQDSVDLIKEKAGSPIVETNIRLVVSATEESLAEKLLHNFQSAFNQFENPGRQSIKWQEVKRGTWFGLKESDFFRAFVFRLFVAGEKLPLNLKELSGLLHFHTESLDSSSSLARSSTRSAPPPAGLLETGTLLGTNSFQGLEKKIYLAPEDRLRHLYVIGQTGTGKSTLLKNMIIDDIKRGEGVSFIDPHGSDVLDIMSKIPKERIDDVIYFDPASMERPMALNMLEYDPRYPEQKTFVVNELFSIFQKLYGGVPESMGPMFEQYFRNATMLVIEDPETGSTLLDVSRVMSNKEFRDLKLSRCKNPIVVQFWREVAEKAGGEASLANIVPYITSKFDVFLANDIMRPIIAQEKSSFNFREIMDGKKILLVNLSKGRLGDINANLIGLILVGKILMAALSRVDSVGQSLPPFYLYIDEFQNITTDSIATILSEARKYKLSLTIAHQFIAQLQEEIRDAVFGNVGNLAAFRVGQDDAEYLEKQFAPVFSAQDIAGIDNFNAFIKILLHGKPTEPFDIRLMPRESGDMSQVEAIKQLSALKYGRDKAEVEATIMGKYQK